METLEVSSFLYGFFCALFVIDASKSYLATFSFREKEKGKLMNLKVRNEAKYQVIELDEINKNKTANCLGVSQFETETDQHFNHRIQVEFNNQFNKPEYNIFHRETRHVVQFSDLTGGNLSATNIDEMLYSTVADKEAFGLSAKATYQEKYDAACKRINSLLKPDAAKMIIAIILDGVSVEDYARSIDDKPNNVSKRFCRAKQKLKKLGKNVLFGAC